MCVNGVDCNSKHPLNQRVGQQCEPHLKVKTVVQTDAWNTRRPEHVWLEMNNEIQETNSVDPHIKEQNYKHWYVSKVRDTQVNKALSVGLMFCFWMEQRPRSSMLTNGKTLKQIETSMYVNL